MTRIQEEIRSRAEQSQTAKTKNRKNSIANMSGKKSILFKTSTGQTKRVSTKSVIAENCLPTNSKAHLNLNLTMKFGNRVTTNQNIEESQKSFEKSKNEFLSIDYIKAGNAPDYLGTNRSPNAAKHKSR
jgi:sugar diacid utilization regulator